jgi:predicted Zn-dependent protease
MKRYPYSSRAVAVALAVLFTVPAFPASPRAPQLPNPGSTGMTREEQEKTGLEVMSEVYKQMPVLPDSSPITQYVQQLGKKLEKQIPAQYSWPYQFHVVQQKEINAFALPGGPIFINVGTINSAANEAQLAGVMAHEMSHVYMQHSAKQAPKQSLAQILAAASGVLGNSALASLARAGIQLGAGTVLMKYSRSDEGQADSVGAIIMYRAGYNPAELANFFEVLAKQGGSPPQFLSDHPNPGNRCCHCEANPQLAAGKISRRHQVLREYEKASRKYQILHRPGNFRRSQAGPVGQAECADRSGTARRAAVR